MPQLQSRGLLGPWQEGDPPRLTVVFDREGWSPALFAGLRAQGIAVPSRVKGAREERWPDADFAPAQLVVSAPCSESVQIGRVAERTLDPGAKGRPARESASGPTSACASRAAPVARGARRGWRGARASGRRRS